MRRRLVGLGRIAALTAIVASAGFSAPSPAVALLPGALPVWMGEVFDDTGAALDDVVIVYYGALDQGSVPAVGDFVVTIDGVTQTPSSVSIPYVLYGGLLGAVRLGLSTPISPGQTVTVSYTPDAVPGDHPLRIGIDPVASFDGVPLQLLDPQPFNFFLGIADEFRGHDHITAFFSQPLGTGPLPDPGDFSVTRTTSGGITDAPLVVALSSIYPGYGFGFLDLKLNRPLAWDDTVWLSYTPGTTPLLDLAGTSSAPGFGPPDSGGVIINLANTLVGTGISVAPTTDTGAPSPVDLTFGTVATAGTTTVTVVDTAAPTAPPPPPTGYEISGSPVYYDIHTTATYSGSITVCLSYAGITPAPTSLLHYEGGAWKDITTSIDTVNEKICGTTTSLSPFAIARTLYTFAGFFQPINDPISATSPMSVFKGGSTIPVKFALTHSDGTRILDTDAAAIASACGATIALTKTSFTAPPVDEAVTSTTPSAGVCFRYDGNAHQFIFNLGTKALPTNAQYRLVATVAAPDGTVLATHQVAIGLR